MITFLNIGHHGRLGNVLFQFAFLKSLQLKYGFQIVLPDDMHNRVWHGQKCVLDCFQVNYKSLPIDYIFSRLISRYYEPENRQRQYIEETFSDDTDYVGFFQNYSYFAGLDVQIKSELQLKPELQDQVNKRFNEIGGNGPQIVSIQVRRGDQMEQGRGNQELLEPDGSLSPNCLYGKYLSKCIEKIPGPKVFMVSVGGSRTNDNQADYDWCVDNFKNLDIDFFMSPAESDIEDFGLMTRCHHNILGLSSTYGWWVGYLNQNQDKVVCCADTAPSLKPNTTIEEGYYPPSFYKIPLWEREL